MSESERPAPPQNRPSPNHTNATQCNAQLRRRRDAARRLPVLDCGCSDPWPCRCFDEPVSDKMDDAAIFAAELLDDLGFPGIFKRDACQGMWRRGRRDLASESYRRSHGEA